MVTEGITLKTPKPNITEHQEVETKFTLKPVTHETEEIQEQITFKPKEKMPQVFEEASEQITLKKEVHFY